MKLNTKTTQEIVKRVQRVAKPDRIILFGSAATGKMTRHSDIDLLILKENSRDPFKESLRVREELEELGFPFDVFVMSSSRFEITKDIIGGLAYPANKYGKVLYG